MIASPSSSSAPHQPTSQIQLLPYRTTPTSLLSSSPNHSSSMLRRAIIPAASAGRTILNSNTRPAIHSCLRKASPAPILLQRTYHEKDEPQFSIPHNSHHQLPKTNIPSLSLSHCSTTTPLPAMSAPCPKPTQTSAPALSGLLPVAT